MPPELSVQVEVCRRHGAVPDPPLHDSRLGISASARAGDVPLHGMRIRPNDSANGWFIWAGELSDDPDFFLPSCAFHIPDVLPLVLPYLALPAGWRFLVAPGYEDVWFDPDLLNTTW